MPSAPLAVPADPWPGARWLGIVQLVVLALGAVVLVDLAWGHGGGLTRLIRSQMANAIHEDSSLYLAVGNGMRHGLTPWVDLFETKPPLLFWFARLLIALDPERMNAGVLTLPILLTLALAPVLVVARRLRQTHAPRTIAVPSLVAVVMAAAWIFTFAVAKAGFFQGETFGASFTVGSLLALTLPRRRWGWPLAITAGAFAVLSKETFAPVLFSLAAWLLVVRAPSFARATRDLALFVAGVLLAALVLLAVTGLLGPYFRVYLPWMGVLRVPNFWSRFGRVLAWRPVWANLVAFSPVAPFFPLLWLALVLLPAGSRRREWFLRAFFGCASLMIAFAAVGFGGEYWRQHVVHLVPWCAVSVWLVPWRRLDPRVLTLAALLSLGIVYGTARSAPTWAPYGPIRHHQVRRVARALDAIVRSCGYDSYQFVGTGGIRPFAFTETPPRGPFFFQWPPFFSAPGRAPAFGRLMDQIAVSQLLVVGRDPFTMNRGYRGWFDLVLEEEFTLWLPACAVGPVAKLPRTELAAYPLWFRRAPPGRSARSRVPAAPLDAGWKPFSK